ncbi:protein HIDE1 [Dasypus novemcinctus]|uniref:protein HIDE1 n=1 Tax=Dasypus novemcinctus TaxID=9361 RepID=UPI00265E5B45|nr:protein HIDE1 [Dasypus novemcinctus]
MTWPVLLLAAGSLAIPAPTIMLVDPHPSGPQDPIHIACVAPGGFPGANFTLYCGEHVVQLLQAPAGQLGVTFNVSGCGTAPGDKFSCQYGVLGEHSQLQLSDLSQAVHVSFPVPTWILALSLSLAGAFLLLAVLGTVTLIIRKVKIRNLQKKRERESCWVQNNFATTDMAFDNSLFAISMKMPSEEDAAATLDARPGSSHTGPRKRPTSSSSSPEPPEFSTFRGGQ